MTHYEAVGMDGTDVTDTVANELVVHT